MMTELNLNRDDLIKLLKFTLARVNELANIISEDEQLTEAHATISAARTFMTDTPYPPNWPYGQKSKKTMKNNFDYEMVDYGDYEP